MKVGMKYYNYQRAKQLIEELKVHTLVSAELGMNEDWYYTVEDIWNNKDGYLVNLDKEGLKIFGIDGSNWATPTLVLKFSDGREISLECSVGENSLENKPDFRYISRVESKRKS